MGRTWGAEHSPILQLPSELWTAFPGTKNRVFSHTECCTNFQEFDSQYSLKQEGTGTLPSLCIECAQESCLDDAVHSSWGNLALAPGQQICRANDDQLMPKQGFPWANQRTGHLHCNPVTPEASNSTGKGHLKTWVASQVRGSTSWHSCAKYVPLELNLQRIPLFAFIRSGSKDVTQKHSNTLGLLKLNRLASLQEMTENAPVWKNQGWEHCSAFCINKVILYKTLW